MVKSPAVVTNFTSYSAGAFARSVAGCSSAASKALAVAAGALAAGALAAGAAFFAGAGVEVWAWASAQTRTHKNAGIKILMYRRMGILHLKVTPHIMP